MRLHPAQRAYYHSKARINVVPAGRRSGKTELAKRRLVKRALSSYRYDDAHFFACGPTHQQAKNIFWLDLKRLVPGWAMDGRPRDGELEIHLINDAVIRVAGLDKPERIEGVDWDGGVITEFANTKPGLLDAHIYPMMTRGGWLDVESVPEGRNHFYDIALEARGDDSGEMALHHWTAEDVLPLYLGEAAARAELRAAKRRMDPITYRQEYGASFETFEGLAYYAFDASAHCRELPYCPDLPLIFCFDFNESPGVAVVAQEIPRGHNIAQKVGIPTGFTAVIGEVHIPRHSKTPKVCQRLLDDWSHHKDDVLVYADATGGAGGSAKVDGSDLDLIRKELRPHFMERLRWRVPGGNPAERARVNAMNSRLRSASGRVKMLVDPKRAPMLTRDLENVTTKDDGSGELDKSVKELTHCSDALGYYVVAKFPVFKHKTSVQEMA